MLEIVPKKSGINSLKVWGDALSTVNDNLGAMFGMVDENGNVMSLTEGIGYNWK